MTATERTQVLVAARLLRATSKLDQLSIWLTLFTALALLTSTGPPVLEIVVVVERDRAQQPLLRRIGDRGRVAQRGDRDRRQQQCACGRTEAFGKANARWPASVDCISRTR